MLLMLNQSGLNTQSLSLASSAGVCCYFILFFNHTAHKLQACVQKIKAANDQVLYATKQQVQRSFEHLHRDLVNGFEKCLMSGLNYSEISLTNKDWKIN